MSDPNTQPPVDPSSGGSVPPVPPAGGSGQTPPPPAQTPPPGAYPPPPAGGYAPPPAGGYAPPPAGGYPPPPGAPYASAPGSNQLSPSDEKLWATLIHVGGAVFVFTSIAAWLPSLIGYLVLKDRGPFIRSHTQAALNFQLTMIIALIVGWITTLIFIGWIIVPAVAIVTVVFSIIAAIKANRGELYTYPLSIPFIKN
ncbi:DUF4870 domain-containing protein [Plantibacter sp. Mn2098]|uniref:DUF4870 domain-containing protein n=1 Tax=Plantibacter sp. Mn2098 TaxID=3395266 RepID=UPI003BD8DF0F